MYPADPDAGGGADADGALLDGLPHEPEDPPQVNPPPAAPPLEDNNGGLGLGPGANAGGANPAAELGAGGGGGPGADPDGQWNPMEWDRAAEELTWERLLGLDGSLVFLEHVFWVVSLNTLFIVVFGKYSCPWF